MNLCYKESARVEEQCNSTQKKKYRGVRNFPSSDQKSIMKRWEKKDSRTKNNDLINHASNIYGLNVKDSIEKMLSTLIDNRMMGRRMNDCAHNIIETKIKCIFINSKCTTTIGCSQAWPIGQTSLCCTSN